jgi:hypothetical protein
MNTKASVELSKNTQKTLVAYLSSRYKDFPMEEVRDRLEKIDKAIQLESDLRNKGRKDYFEDTEIPTVRSPISKLGNFLIDTFVGTRIFEAVSSDPANAAGVKQFNTVLGENSRSSNWPREFILVMRDIAKYPYAAISCNWEAEEILSIVDNIGSASATAGGATVESVPRQGNVMKRKDLYNTFYDTSVPVNEVHSKGEFSASISRISQIALFQLITRLKINGGKVMNELGIWDKAGTTPNHYYRPNVKPLYDNEQATSGWSAFFEIAPKNGTSKMRTLGKGARYEHIELNARIIPSMFGMKVPAADKLQIWKFHIVNWDTIIFAERQSNAHSYLPDVYAQITEEGIDTQSKSMAELLVPIQNLSTHIHDAHLMGLKRNLVDRAIYDSQRINRADIDSDDPVGKIPVRPSMLKGSRLQDAYYPIPFSDSAAGSRFNELGFLSQLGDKTVGFNQPQQGQFQKGNKTLGEFNEVMNNADDDLRTFAKLVESTMMMPVKTIVKTNVLQFQAPESVTDEEGQSTKVNPVEIRRTAMQFKLADGLVDKSQLLDLPTANSLLQLVLQVPQLQQKYDVNKLIDHIMNGVGFDTASFSNEGTGGPAPGAAPAPPPAPQQ